MDDDDDLDEINHRWMGRALATTKIAANALRLASRRVLKRDGDPIDGVIGEELAKELDRMKGLAMKVGQILSYFEGVLPEQTHQALRKLQRGAQPLAWEKIAPILELAFGAKVDQLFDSIDTHAIAAASIGQVHRAIFEGEPVAVKVQYPNVRETFEADFGRMGTIARLASLATAVDGVALANELRERVMEECDYLREADHQEAFARAFADDPVIAIPRVVRARSCANVLTTRWHDGDDFYRFAENASTARKNQAGLVLARFAYRSLYGLGTLNADPHPGNYVFEEGDRIVFLDFGCVRRFDAAYVERERRLARVIVEGRRREFDEALSATGMVADLRKFDYESHWTLMRHLYAPYLGPRFRFTFEYVREITEYKKAMSPNLRRMAIPPPWIWQQRLQWGLHAVLARLDAEGPFRSVFLHALETPLTPLEIAA